jgi:hypothetical protein
MRGRLDQSPKAATGRNWTANPTPAVGEASAATTTFKASMTTAASTMEPFRYVEYRIPPR